MKEYINLFLLLLLLPVCRLSAQTEVQPVVVEEITRSMSKGEQAGFKADIPQAVKKDVEGEWSKIIRKDTKSKVENVNNELSIAGTVLKEISVNPISVYAVMNQYPDRIELNAFFEVDSAVFATKEKNETEYLAAKKFVRDFAVSAYRSAVQNEMDGEDKKLKEMESEFSKLVKENDNLHKKINEEKRSIESTNKKVATSKLDQERVRKQVQEQKEELAKVRDTGNEVIIKENEKKLKTFESEVSKLEKQEDGMHKDNTKSDASIREYERSITANEATMKLQQEEIAKQKQLIQNIRKKMEGIK